MTDLTKSSAPVVTKGSGQVGGFFAQGEGSSRVLHLIGKGERELQEWCLLRQNQSPKIASRITHPLHNQHKRSQNPHLKAKKKATKEEERE